MKEFQELNFQEGINVYDVQEYFRNKHWTTRFKTDLDNSTIIVTMTEKGQENGNRVCSIHSSKDGENWTKVSKIPKISNLVFEPQEKADYGWNGLKRFFFAGDIVDSGIVR